MCLGDRESTFGFGQRFGLGQDRKLIPNCNIREFLLETAEISKMCTMKKNSTVWLPSPDGCDNRGRLDDFFIESATVEL